MTGHEIERLRLLARQDQDDAREEGFDRVAQKIGLVFLALVGLVFAYAMFVMSGDLPAPSWAPMHSNVDPGTSFTPPSVPAPAPTPTSGSVAGV